MAPRVCASVARDASLQISRASTTATRPTCLVALAVADTSRSFGTTTPRQKISKARFDMFQWLEKVKDQFNTQDSGPSYLGPLESQPFPNNPQFRSQPVLAEQAKRLIYEKVVDRGEALTAVAEEMGIDVRRIAAVVRLKQVEKDMVAAGKPLAMNYAKAVMGMLPKTYYHEGSPNNRAHEPINDIPVHKLTTQQLFVPVSESRRFTREDAAKAFHERMLSADARSPQRELIEAERAIVKGEATRPNSIAAFRNRAQELEEAHAKRLAKERIREEENTARVKTDRCEFRFKNINAENVGRDGRSRNGVGWRYGAPLQDRKRGMIKIPTSVP